MAIYMKFGTVDGDVATKGFEKWIELKSMQFSIARDLSGLSFGAATRQTGIPTLSEITVSKDFDKSSGKLYQDSLNGKVNTKVQIAVTASAANATAAYLAYELTDCGVSSYAISSAHGAPTHETLSLNFAKIIITPSPLDAMGSPKKGDVVGYDLRSMTTS